MHALLLHRPDLLVGGVVGQEAPGRLGQLFGRELHLPLAELPGHQGGVRHLDVHGAAPAALQAGQAVDHRRATGGEVVDDVPGEPDPIDLERVFALEERVGRQEGGQRLGREVRREGLLRRGGRPVGRAAPGHLERQLLSAQGRHARGRRVQRPPDDRAHLSDRQGPEREPG